jgi:hypothetical protein
MQYSQFEKILADTFSIKEKGLGAFRARLRHLRNLGVPDIPKRGSGNTVVYKTADLLTALIALELQALGSAPAVSAELATFARDYFDLVEWSDADVFLLATNVPGGELIEDRVKGAPLKFEKPPAGSAKVKVRRGATGFRFIKNPFGGHTQALVVIGAQEAGDLVTKATVLGSSLINLSQHFRALPTEH